MGIFDIDLNESYGSSSFDNLPDGSYQVVIDRVDIKVPKNGGNEYLAITYQVIAGEYSNRLIFHNLSVLHTTENVRNMARAMYQKVCRACGFEAEPRTSDQFLNHEVIVTLKTKKSGDQFVNNVIGLDAGRITNPVGTSDPNLKEQALTPLNNDEIPF